jgi:hypothetical protein
VWACFRSRRQLWLSPDGPPPQPLRAVSVEPVHRGPANAAMQAAIQVHRAELFYKNYRAARSIPATPNAARSRLHFPLSFLTSRRRGACPPRVDWQRPTRGVTGPQAENGTSPVLLMWSAILRLVAAENAPSNARLAGTSLVCLELQARQNRRGTASSQIWPRLAQMVAPGLVLGQLGLRGACRHRPSSLVLTEGPQRLSGTAFDCDRF